MNFKVGFALLTFSIAVFASGRIERLIADGQSFGGVVWAQDAGDAEDVSSTEAPPDLNGTSWTGPLEDASAGEFTLTIDIFQKHNKIRGDYSTSTGKSGAFTGKFESDTSLTFTLKGHHGCRVAFSTTLVSPTEMQGTYTSKHCNSVADGTADLTEQQ